jgi:NADH-ubiquinone oxidoreductase chain 2
MPKIAILVLLLELQSQIGVIGGITSYTYNSSYELIEKVYSITTLNGNSLILGETTIYVLKNLLLISSLLSLIIGTVVGLCQTKIKRLLAYSTISHIGFILLALAINSEQSIDSLIFYIIQYSITNLNTFLIIIALPIYSKFTYFKNVKLNDINFINEIKGQFFLNPILSLSLSVCLFSMAGIPPLIGFFSKQFVLYSAIENGYYFISIVAIIVSVISASYYLKIVKVLHTSMTKSPSFKLYDQEAENLHPEYKLDSITSVTNLHSFIISCLTLSIIFFVLKPSLILNSTQLLSLSIFNY